MLYYFSGRSQWQYVLLAVEILVEADRFFFKFVARMKLQMLRANLSATKESTGMHVNVICLCTLLMVIIVEYHFCKLTLLMP